MPGRALRVLWYSFRYCRTPDKRVGRLVTLVAASRLCVIPMTLYSVAIGGALAWAVLGRFDPLVFAGVLLGFVLAHLADNLLNDLYDYKKGVDTSDYFRALYGPHPILDGLLPASTAKAAVLAVLALDAALAILLGILVSPLIPVLALIGALVMASYAGIGVDAKRLGLGELLVAVVWGPVMAGGTILALTGELHPGLAAAYMPYALAVSLVLIGKHMDKHDQDRQRGVGTLPVRLGLPKTRRLASTLALALPPLAAAGLYAVLRTPLALLPLASLLVAVPASRALSSEKPHEPPRGWRVWPLWYVAHAYAAMDSLGRTTLAAVLAAGLAARGHTLASIILVVLVVIVELRIGARLTRIVSSL